MTSTASPKTALALAALACIASNLALAAPLPDGSATNVVSDTGHADISPMAANSTPDAPGRRWNLHAQNTDIVQYHPAFPADYSGPNSMSSHSEVNDTVSLDLLAGIRLWDQAEFHVDGLMWQGFGLSHTLGAEGFPNGEAFRLGTRDPNVNFSRVFLRQNFGFGGDQEDVSDDALDLAGKRDVSRITLTVGKFSAKDIFDNNAYANDPRTQFMNWSLMANEAWDYPADSLGYITGLAAELNQPQWTLRYGFFQMPKESNGVALDQHFLEAWAMVTEFERRFKLGDHPGAVRFLAFLNHAHMGAYGAALSVPGTDITQTRDYRYKYGFGFNAEQDLGRGVGAFARLGWSDGHTEGWAFSDVDETATAGLSVKGVTWGRADDTFAVAGALNGASSIHQAFLAAGGTGILAGDGRLTYGLEELVETYYDCAIWKTIHATADYQFIANPAFNRDRGPVSVLAARLHWEF